MLVRKEPRGMQYLGQAVDVKPKVSLPEAHTRGERVVYTAEEEQNKTKNENKQFVIPKTLFKNKQPKHIKQQQKTEKRSNKQTAFCFCF